MNKIDKFVASALKPTIVLYILVLGFQAKFRPNIYRVVDVPLEIFLGLMVVYICAKSAFMKLGLIQGSSITVNRKTLVNISYVVVVVLLSCAGTEYLFHNLSVEHQAEGILQASKDGEDVLGVPIRAGWIITGSVKMKGAGGAASLSIPVQGSRAAGELKVKGIKKEGSWHIVDLYLIVDGDKAIVQIPH